MAKLSLRPLAHLDWLLLGASIVLVLFGVIALASVTIAKSPPDWKTFTHQVVFLCIGIVFFIIATVVDYRVLRGYSTLAYVAAGALLIAVLIFGTTIRSTTGWFVFAGFSFQPVELVKIFWIIAFAAYLARYGRAFDQWRHILISGGFALGLIGLIMLQPDLGSALVVGGIFLGLLLTANIQWKQVLLIFLILALGAVFSYFFLLRGYQKDRIRVLFQANSDPQGRGYNTSQAMIAIGSGQLFGHGFGQGTQSQLNFIPEQQTDFIFAVLAEEFGFVGVLVLLGSFGIVLVRTMAIARQSRDDFGAFLCSGISIAIAIHLLINVGMNMGLVPVTGIPLPFVSAGGSSLISSLIGLGLIQSVAIRRRTMPT